MAPLKTRVYLVHSDDTYNRCVAASLLRGAYDVHAASDGLSVLSVARLFRPQVAVIELSPKIGPSGALIAQSLRRGCEVGVIFISSEVRGETAIDGLEAGGDDCVPETVPQIELKARIMAVLRRGAPAEDITYACGDLTLHDRTQSVFYGGRRITLTYTEFRLLHALMKARGGVVAKITLKSDVWGSARCRDNVIEVHICSLRRKLETGGPLIETVRGYGYALRHPDMGDMSTSVNSTTSAVRSPSFRPMTSTSMALSVPASVSYTSYHVHSAEIVYVGRSGGVPDSNGQTSLIGRLASGRGGAAGVSSASNA